MIVVTTAWLILFAAPASAEDLEPVLAKAMEGSKVPATGILVIRNAKFSGEGVRGVRQNDGTDPVRLDDVWHIGSDGKAMTATLIARLVDRGVLSWSTPLDQMLPELAARRNPQYRSVTLLELLSHHSGLPHDIADGKVLQTMFADKTPASLAQRRYAYISRVLQEAPVASTTASSYSNTGRIIAAVIAERATGSSFEDLIRKEVFISLGMRRVGFGVTRPGQNLGHVAGKPATREVIPDFFAPAGNMYMPLHDWALFCIDQINGANGGGKLLKPQTYRLMQTAQPGGTTGLAGPFRTKRRAGEARYSRIRDRTETGTRAWPCFRTPVLAYWSPPTLAKTWVATSRSRAVGGEGAGFEEPACGAFA
jgi:CubicO group peptidase (beta-lactamase class C family)